MSAILSGEDIRKVLQEVIKDAGVTTGVDEQVVQQLARELEFGSEIVGMEEAALKSALSGTKFSSFSDFTARVRNYATTGLLSTGKEIADTAKLPLTGNSITNAPIESAKIAMDKKKLAGASVIDHTALPKNTLTLALEAKAEAKIVKQLSEASSQKEWLDIISGYQAEAAEARAEFSKLAGGAEEFASVQAEFAMKEQELISSVADKIKVDEKLTSITQKPGQTFEEAFKARQADLVSKAGVAVGKESTAVEAAVKQIEVLQTTINDAAKGTSQKPVNVEKIVTAVRGGVGEMATVLAGGAAVSAGTGGKTTGKPASSADLKKIASKEVAADSKKMAEFAEASKAERSLFSKAFMRKEVVSGEKGKYGLSNPVELKSKKMADMTKLKFLEKYHGGKLTAAAAGALALEEATIGALGLFGKKDKPTQTSMSQYPMNPQQSQAAYAAYNGAVGHGQVQEAQV